MTRTQKRQKFVLVGFSCDLYLPGLPYRYNWVKTDGKELLMVENTGTKYIQNKLEELGGKRCRDFHINTVSELTRAEYLNLKAQGKVESHGLLFLMNSDA